MAFLKAAVPLLLLLLVSCSGGGKLMEGERRLLSHHASPSWIVAPEQEERPGLDVYHGLSGEFPEEGATRADARDNARSQAVANILYHVEKLVDRAIGSVMVNHGLLTPAMIQEYLARRVADGIEGEEIRHWHVERWETMEKGVPRKSFTAHCLLVIPGNAARRTLVRLLETRALDTDDPSVHEQIELALKELEAVPELE